MMKHKKGFIIVSSVALMAIALFGMFFVRVARPPMVAPGSDGGGYPVQCCMYNSQGNYTCFQTMPSICSAIGGAIIGSCAQGPVNNSVITTNALTPTQNFDRADLDDSKKDWLDQLYRAAFRSGIGNRTWDKHDYNCANFADDLEQYLTSLGYDASFTVLMEYSPSTGAYRDNSAHAVVDVHTPDGKIVIIEPQETEKGNKDMRSPLDKNADGKITAHVEQRLITDVREVTENNYLQINFYDNRQDAKAHGSR